MSSASMSRGVLAQVDVVGALVLRETRTRFGAHQLGYLWAIIEPALWIGTFYILFSFANRQAPEGMDVISFLLTGLIPYELFSKTAGQVSSSISSNKALLFYPQVRPLDLAISRSVLELATSIAVFLTFVVGLALVDQRWPSIGDPLVTLLGFMAAAGLGAGVGLIFCALGVSSKIVDRVRGPLLRPLFWCSGVFFTANGLPSNVREVLLYNPVFHAIDLVRHGWFPSYYAHHVDVEYLLMWLLCLMLLGLLLERIVRRKIEVT